MSDIADIEIDVDAHLFLPPLRRQPTVAIHLGTERHGVG
jgi:hypothetical protein